MLKLNRTHRWAVLVGTPAVVLAAAACATPADEPNHGQGGASSQGTGGSTSVFGGTSSTTGGTTGTTGGTSTTGGATGTTGGTASTNGGTGTTTGGATGTTGGGTSTTGGGTGTTGGGTSTTGGSGTGGAAPVVKLCATKKVLTIPLMTNFDSYDGKTAADAWGFAFNGTPADAGVMYAGTYTYNDMTGTPFLGMVGGANASTYAISASNTMATAWGGAIGIWMGCVDAKAYKGISFNARGTIPTGSISVSVTMEQTAPPDAKDPAGGGTCDAATSCKNPMIDVPVTADWALKQIPWSMFAAGVGSGMAAVTPTGDGIAGLTFQVGLTYMPSAADPMVYVAVPGPYQLDIDDIGFY